MALGGSLTQINLGVQGVTQGSHHSDAQRVNPGFRVGSNFQIIPEQYFSGVDNVVEFLENMDNNLTYYEIPTQLACAYLKGHLTGRALDWFEVLGYRVVEHKETDYVPLKQALSEKFPVVRNRSELETRFYSSSQKHNQKPSDFVYDLLKIHKILKLEMTEEKLIDHIISRKIGGSSWESRDIKPNENNRSPNRYRQENWRETRGNNKYADNSRPRREFNRFDSQGVADNQRFDGRRRGGQSDHRYHNQGGRQGGSSNSSFRDQPWLTHVLYHEIDTRDKGPVVSRPYRYDRVKQGIINYHIEKMLQEGAAPNFQKAIDIILKPVIGRFVSVYMDDVIITSPSFNEHLDHLNQGWWDGGYQKLISQYADRCEPLYRLKKKGAKFNWSTEAQDYFDKIKRALTEATVLQLPNFTKQFNLFTDASGVGIRAVLNQNHRPIAFVSRILNKAERNYTLT
ncbi:uncharacterized protein TNCV_3991941 [Trichonephila clavipes]|uniref:Reverse transcriptase/retrotransposon-derived protein RNase H-like domain-containing protein n=1 Tax=Trichonephila clavipes TaxID=2585209 RepID=A0A8X6T1A5_TRICX|nr:uncharacterized protein TNCV_3991941 [Trichonephila clavipes]